MKSSKSNVIRLKSHVMPLWHTRCDHIVGSNQDSADSKLYEFVRLCQCTPRQQVMPDDHSEVVPLLPIPNRTVKRLCADDSAGSRVKVGHRQALTKPPKPPVAFGFWGFGLYISVGVCVPKKLFSKDFDGSRKTDVYCKASLITELFWKKRQRGL